MYSGESGFIRVSRLCWGRSGCIHAKKVVLRQSGCICAEVVVFLQGDYFRESGFVRAKEFVLK